MLVVLDGWGWREEAADNAIRQADTPSFDRLWEEMPHAFLRTSGRDVGLPEGQMGNSEVGHMNIGAGRVVMQELPRISQAIEAREIEQAPALTGLVDALRRSGGACHLLGLLSDGGVHAHQDHAVALAWILVREGIPVRIHVFMDGRDTAPRSGAAYLAAFRRKLPPDAAIVTVCGRYYAMDRDRRWDRVSRAYGALVDAVGNHYADAESAVDAAYNADVSDEFILPAAVDSYSGMRDGDGLLCFNFRADRVRELLSALLAPDFRGFPRQRVVRFAAAAGMTHYSDPLADRMQALFPPASMEHLLGQVVAAAGLRQVRMAETEKYPHVTYFLNGGMEAPVAGEDRIMVPSPKVATYDLQPEMSAPELTDKAVSAIASGEYDLIVLNFANPDMVGHTGCLDAAIRAVEAVDHGLGRIMDAIEQAGGALLVIADHGNCELMRDPQTGGPHTAHTTNRVPAVLFEPGLGASEARLADGILADVAPTLLALLGLGQPAEMTGRSLLRPN
jgi:2,3-bisphosphoglycerate-independent phosphoglycerate mutase